MIQSNKVWYNLIQGYAMRGIQLDAMRGIQCYVKTQDSYACLTQAGPTLSAESPSWHTSGTNKHTHTWNNFIMYKHNKVNTRSIEMLL